MTAPLSTQTEKDQEISLVDMQRHLRGFAAHHGLVLDLKGECGFGRPCVGLLKGDNYVEYCPMRSNDWSRIVAFDDDRLRPTEDDAPDAYHKHDCFAVLALGDEPNYNEATRQLHAWISRLRALGELEVASYSTGATGFQAILSGVTSYAFRFKSEVSHG